MRSTIGSLLLVCAAAVIGQAQQGARPARDNLLVSTAWLAQHVRDQNLVLLHIGEEQEYKAKHIPGARFTALDDIAISDHSGNGLMLEMPPVDKLRGALAALGISDGSRIVVYYGKDWVSPASRVVLTLDYAGLGDRVSMLDGGMQAWIRDGHDVTAAETAPRTGTLSALRIKPVIVDAAYVRAHLNARGVSIVDARTPSFYDGGQTGGSHDVKHRTGHIAGAKSVPFTQTADDQNRFKSTTDLEYLFARAGIAPGDTIVGYCHIGQQATALLFAARLAGHPVLLYDGSFEDWSRRPAAEFPVENPSAASKP